MQRFKPTFKGFLTGLTGFLAASYIIVLAPTLLSVFGVDKSFVFTATCLTASFSCLLGGFILNRPLIFSPAVGILGFFAYTLGKQMGLSFNMVLTFGLISSAILILLGAFGVGHWLVGLFTEDLRKGILAGIGFFLVFISLANAGLVGFPLSIKLFLSKRALIFLFGLFLIFVFEKLRLPAPYFWSLVAVAVVAVLLGVRQDTYEEIFKLRLFSPVFNFGLLRFVPLILLGLTFASLLDLTATLMAISPQDLDKGILAAGIGGVVASLFGVSPVGVYLESMVIKDEESNFPALVISVLFLLSLFLGPLVSKIPPLAVSPVLFYIGGRMAVSMLPDTASPAKFFLFFFPFIFIPLTMNIATGVALSLLTFPFFAALEGRRVNLWHFVLSFVSLLYFLIVGGVVK